MECLITNVILVPLSLWFGTWVLEMQFVKIVVNGKMKTNVSGSRYNRTLTKEDNGIR